jgi:multicomponent K+:H+ antiporter subunit D
VSWLVVAPLLVPAIAGAASLLFMRRRRLVGAGLSIGSVVVLGAIALRLFLLAAEGDVVAYALGSWPAPFGIVLVVDRLAALMVLVASVLALVVLCHAVLTGLDRRGWHFHPLFQFQLLGLNGAFLTGDLFNLFVFFEVLLIASYGLMLHGQGAERLKAGVQYVIINLVGSILFLIGIGILYGVTGTLNMADMAGRIAGLPEGDLGLLRAGALVLATVFALKAALLPLHLWLPRTYAGASPVVAALFAIMTKVGVYAIIRTTTLMFGGTVPFSWLLPCALATVAIGFAGLLAAKRLRELAAFALLGSGGTLLVAISPLEPRSVAAGLYYLPHTTLAAALLFLVIHLVGRRRGERGDAIVAGPRFPGFERLGLLFLLAAVALAGLPPLSGFVGKLIILDATADHPQAGWIWGTILVTTLVAVLGLARAGSTIFWKSASALPPPASAAPELQRWVELIPSVVLVALLAALTLWAGAATDFAERTAAQLFSPGKYVEAVLGSGGRQ